MHNHHQCNPQLFVYFFSLRRGHILCITESKENKGNCGCVPGSVWTSRLTDFRHPSRARVKLLLSALLMSPLLIFTGVSQEPPQKKPKGVGHRCVVTFKKAGGGGGGGGGMEDSSVLCLWAGPEELQPTHYGVHCSLRHLTCSASGILTESKISKSCLNPRLSTFSPAPRCSSCQKGNGPSLPNSRIFCAAPRGYMFTLNQQR